MTNRHEPDAYVPNRELRLEDLCLEAEQKRYRRHSIAAEPASQPTVLVLRKTSHTKKRKKMPAVCKALLILLACLLSIAVIAVSTVMVLQSRGRKALLPTEPVTLIIPEVIEQETVVEVVDDGRTVKYNGETYRFNENRTNILCIGVDKESLGTEEGVIGTGGQADTLIVLSVDTVTGAIDALAVSRDTVADIDLFAADGSFVGTERMQLCLSYAYGDGREGSCETTTRAVSRLLYGIPINTYFAIDVNSITTLNDAIGGVDVTLTSEFRTSTAIYGAGEHITLWGKDALWYVRMRDTEQLASNLDRMERQKQYLSAFATKAIAATKADLQVPLRLYETIADDATTSLTPSKITFLATSLVRHNQPLNFTSVAGNVVKGDDGYAEFHVDEKALYEQVLNIFYTKQ